MINAGRFTHGEVPEGTTVFLIGMRVNDVRRVRDWWYTAVQMPRMLERLSQHPELGLLSYQMYLGRSVMIVSYWSSPDKLREFASATDQPHLVPWREFNTKIRQRGAVGVWHETYVLQDGHHEAVYVNMPDFGLGSAVGVRPVDPRGTTFRQRLAHPSPVDS